ncbi:MAG TPA: sodium:solute symporter family transporter, partial [Candidatus Tripitaka californicus]|uniref:sodium:solute symporter family transporter n=1 Tax=Candidatus Tripitaka californicus TaxID=3367616 RepID=UPI0040280132
YCLAGRNLPWWLLGPYMVATTFGADTPLAVTEYVRTDGIWRNWFWWNAALGGLLSVFLFSRLWVRARVLTDNELIELRYSGRPAAILRAFKAGYFATVYHFI